MKLEQINQLWEGEIEKGGHKGEFDVIFSPGGKIYTYKATSIYSLAERLEIIPEVNITKVAKAVVESFTAGQSEVVAPAGAGDTIRHLWAGDGYITEKYAGTDEYERPLTQYVLNPGKDPWV